jgi:hypothetical protein
MHTSLALYVYAGMLPGLAGFIAGGATTAAAGAAAVAAAAATAAREDPLSVGCYCAVVCDNGQVSTMYYYFCTLHMHALQCIYVWLCNHAVSAVRALTSSTMAVCII